MSHNAEGTMYQWNSQLKTVLLLGLLSALLPLRDRSWTMSFFATHPATTERVHRLFGLARKWQRVAA